MVVFFQIVLLLIAIPALSAFVCKTNFKMKEVVHLNKQISLPSSQLDRIARRTDCNRLKQLSMAAPAEDVKIRIADLDWKVVPDIWESLAKIIPEKSMLVDPVHGEKVDLTFLQCNNLITTGAAALQSLGLLPDECVSIFAENSYKWFIADQAIMKSGACNSVRGALAPTDELHYIYENSKSVALVVESPNLLQQLFSPTDSDANPSKTSIGTPRFVVVLFSKGMSGSELAAAAGVPDTVKVLSYEELLASTVKEEFKPVERDPK